MAGVDGPRIDAKGEMWKYVIAFAIIKSFESLPITRSSASHPLSGQFLESPDFYRPRPVGTRGAGQQNRQ